MDAYIFSLVTILAAMYFHYLALSPPAAPPKKEFAGPKGDVGAMLVSRYLVRILNVPAYFHFVIELYGVYSNGVSKPISPAICPPRTSNISGVYHPRGGLPPAISLAYLTIIAGGIIRAFCYRSLGRMFRWEVSIQENHKLITSGPYSIVRHPSYVGTWLVGIGHVLLVFAKGTVLRECIVPSHRPWVQWMIWTLAIFRILVPVGLTWRTQSEDRLLKKNFGKEWDAWAAKTKFRVLPFVF